MSKQNGIHIKILLLQKGVSQAEIARQVRVTQATVSRVIAGKRRTPAVRKAVACVCGVRVEDLWPTEAA